MLATMLRVSGGVHSVHLLGTGNRNTGVCVSSPAVKSEPASRRVVVLGSTGSIGTSCLDVLDHLPDRLHALGLSAHSNWETLFEQARRLRPRWVAVTDPDAARTLDRSCLDGACRLLTGPD